MLLGEIIQSQRRRKVPEAATLENPPGSESQTEGSMWALPEVHRLHGEVPMHQSLVQFMRISSQGAGALAEARSVWGQAQRAGVLAEEVLMPERLPASSAGRQEEDVGVGQVPERPRHGVRQTPHPSLQDDAQLGVVETPREVPPGRTDSSRGVGSGRRRSTRAWWLTMTMTP